MNERFVLRRHHLLLLQRANIRFDPYTEWGCPTIDCKRPFGNGDIVGDMAKILGIDPVPTDDEEEHWPVGTRDRMLNIYTDELPTAMEVIFQAQSFELGVYKRDAGHWFRTEEDE